MKDSGNLEMDRERGVSLVRGKWRGFLGLCLDGQQLRAGSLGNSVLLYTFNYGLSIIHL